MQCCHPTWCLRRPRANHFDTILVREWWRFLIQTAHCHPLTLETEKFVLMGLMHVLWDVLNFTFTRGTLYIWDPKVSLQDIHTFTVWLVIKIKIKESGVKNCTHTNNYFESTTVGVYTTVLGLRREYSRISAYVPRVSPRWMRYSASSTVNGKPQRHRSLVYIQNHTLEPVCNGSRIFIPIK